MGKYRGFISIVCVIIMLVCGFLGIKSIFYSGADNTVPDVVGMKSQEAITAMKDAGFMPFIDKVAASAPVDTVVSQSSEAGSKQAKGTTIYLRVSFGGSSMEIPDVTGMKLEDAVKTLQDLGLTVDEIRKIPNKEHPAGVVFAQNPSSPQTVDTSTKITLLVSSSGDESSLIKIPNVVGKTQAEATRAIEASGLKLGEVKLKRSDTVANGSVVSQTPNAGLSVSAGTAVSIDVSSTEAVDDLSIEREPEEKTAPIKRVVVENKEEMEREAANENVARKSQAKQASKAKQEQDALKQKAEQQKREKQQELAKRQEQKKKFELEKQQEQKKKQEIQKQTKQPVSPKTTVANATNLASDKKKPDTAQQPKKPVTQVEQVAKQTKTKQQPAESDKKPSAKSTQAEEEKHPTVQPVYTGKIAKIRYQTPPITGNNMSLKIVIHDDNGVRVLREGPAHSLEYISMNAKYQGTAKITIYLGGEEVWHDKYN